MARRRLGHHSQPHRAGNSGIKQPVRTVSPGDAGHPPGNALHITLAAQPDRNVGAQLSNSVAAVTRLVPKRVSAVRCARIST
jgi:hypothetical protein